MVMSLAEKNKIDNYKAQYNKILSNVNEANKELEKVLRLVDFKKEELRKFHSSVSRASIDLNKYYNTQNNIKINIKKELGSYKRDMDDLLEVVFKLHSENRIKKRQNKKDVSNFLLLINKKKKELSKLSIILNNKKETKKNLEKDINLSLKVYSVNSKKTKSINFDIDKEENKLKTLLKNIEKQEDIFEDVKGNVAKEVLKLKLPIKFLKEREKLLIKRERDFDILVNRLRVLYQELKPGISLSI